MKTEILNKRFIPTKRIAIENKIWLVVYDLKSNCYSNCTYFGKYKTKGECQFYIDYALQNFPML